MADTPRTPLVGALAFAGTTPIQGFIRTPDTGALTATGIAGGIGFLDTGEVTLERMTATGNVVDLELDGPGQVVLGLLTAVGYEPDAGAVILGLLTAAGLEQGLDAGRAVMLPMAAQNDAGYAALQKIRAYGIDSEATSTVYTTKVMNTRNTAVTEYTNFEFNSFAKIGDSYYGAGPAGFVRLDGSTDNGTAIPWKFRTGQLDGKEPNLKRVVNIVAALRTRGPTRVKVWFSDTQYYEYMLPATNLTSINQQRVRTGKGMRSRYYAVELAGVSNSTIELDSLQIDFAETTRRIG